MAKAQFVPRLDCSNVAQRTALFLHGIDPCEVAISEGLYGQAATLMRQQMEILGAIDEVWLDKRNPRSTPKVSSLPEEIRQHYGGLSELAHAAVPDYLNRMHTDIKGDLVGVPASKWPIFSSVFSTGIIPNELTPEQLKRKLNILAT